jgi:hypothetical protein
VQRFGHQVIFGNFRLHSTWSQPSYKRKIGIPTFGDTLSLPLTRSCLYFSSLLTPAWGVISPLKWKKDEITSLEHSLARYLKNEITDNDSFSEIVHNCHFDTPIVHLRKPFRTRNSGISNYYFSRSSAGSSISIAMTPMRCIWSAMDSGFSMPLSTQPVRLVLYNIGEVWGRARGKWVACKYNW